MSFKTRARSDSGYSESVEIYLNFQSSPVACDTSFSNYLGLESPASYRKSRKTKSNVIKDYIPFFTSFPLEYVLPPKNDYCNNNYADTFERTMENGKREHDNTPIPSKCLISMRRNIQNLQETTFKMRALREKINHQKSPISDASMGNLKKRCDSIRATLTTPTSSRNKKCLSL
ncbi:5847_t:CDS:2 [Acaulospora morrowiae]|uniref:5847_t:CDS:1 n=1 Tax=Acaulospora morrowiae TaxID=94023 RepID=A0A9N9BQE2_9GLOM|nr:5847_t:CDS:2 [Acaulospora morrowiae]